MQTLRPPKIENGKYELHWAKRPRYKKKITKLDGAFGMNPSPLVDVAFKVFNNGEQRKELFARLNATYLVAALDSRKASSLERGEPRWGGNSVLTVRRKGTGKKTALG